MNEENLRKGFGGTKWIILRVAGRLVSKKKGGKMLEF